MVAPLPAISTKVNRPPTTTPAFAIKLLKKLAIGCAAVIFAGIVFWEAMYPGREDPRNPHYIAWKMHLLSMDPMRALATMTHGRDSERLVIGRTPDQLKARFGFVKTALQVRPYLRDHCASARPGTDVLFLNDSDWMVVIKNDRATELALCKG